MCCQPRLAFMIQCLAMSKTPRVWLQTAWPLWIARRSIGILEQPVLIDWKNCPEHRRPASPFCPVLGFPISIAKTPYPPINSLKLAGLALAGHHTYLGFSGLPKSDTHQPVRRLDVRDCNLICHIDCPGPTPGEARRGGAGFASRAKTVQFIPLAPAYARPARQASEGPTRRRLDLFMLMPR